MDYAAALFLGAFLAKMVSVAGFGGFAVGVLTRRLHLALVAGAAFGLADTAYVAWFLGTQPAVSWLAGIAAGVVGGSLGYLTAWLGGRKNS